MSSPLGFHQLPQPARVLLGTQFFFDIVRDRTSAPFAWWHREQQSIPRFGVWISCLTPIMIWEFLELVAKQQGGLSAQLSNLFKNVTTFSMEFQRWRVVAPTDFSVLLLAKSLPQMQMQSLAGRMRDVSFNERCVLATAINGFGGGPPMYLLDYPQQCYADLEQSHNLRVVPWK